MKTHTLLTILMFLSFINASKAQKLKMTFDHITSENGLTNSTVHCIIKDKFGFMWFGTSGGLFRYDGANLKIFQNDPKNENSITDNRVNAMLESSDGIKYFVIWDQGLDIYDDKTEQFKHYNQNSKTNPLFNNKIRSIIEAKNKTIWIGLEDGGLNYLDKKTNQIINFKVSKENNCLALAEDKNGLIWFCGQKDGLFNFNPQTKKTTHIDIPAFNINNMNSAGKKMIFDELGNLWIANVGSGLYCYTPSLNTIKHWNVQHPGLACSHIWDLKFDKPGFLWLATDAEGLVYMDIAKDTFTHYKSIVNNNLTLNSNAIYSIYIDESNSIWVGTFNGGVNIYNPNKLKFSCYKPIYLDKTSLSNKSVLCVTEDREKNLWIGTDGGGVNLYNPNKYGDEFIHFNDPNAILSKKSPHVIKSSFMDSNGYIWFGSWGDGMVRLEPKSQVFDYSFNAKLNLQNLAVWGIMEDKDKNLWILVLGESIKRINPKTFEFKDFTSKTNPILKTNFFLSQFKDHKNRLWFGSEGAGLYLYQEKKEDFKCFANDPKNSKSIAGNIIRTIFEDSKKRLWIGTLGSGLSLYNENTNDFTNIGEKEGLASNTINSINEDKEGNLWLASNNGLIKYNHDKKKMKNYDPFDGLQGKEFNYNASISMSNGQIVFGGLEGINFFNPNKINENLKKPPVFITNLFVSNNEIGVNDKTGILKQSLLASKELVFKYNQSSFQFTFSALNYTHPQKNKYAYMLVNFDKKWIEIGSQRNATYTNIDPGDYIFNVKACNNDGVWNETGASIKITILPPFWATWWFRLIYIIVLVNLVWLGFFVRVKALKKQKLALEKKIQERTIELQASNSLLLTRQNEILEQSEELRQQAEEMLQQSEQLRLQRDNLEIQNNKITNQNNHITASVRYALTMQTALLPSMESIEKSMECFVLYKPKDIVSGDYYWYACLDGQHELKNNRFIFSVIDCTGHGVPGAFMTLVADRLLNEAVVEHKLENPADILESIDSGVKMILKQESSSNRDGMDLVVCLFEQQKDGSVNISYAGSRNPLYYYDIELDTIIKLAADHRYIGMMETKSAYVKFSTQNICLKKGDVVFLGTDGYIDQNNDERKRLGTQLYLKYLREYASLPLSEVKEKMELRLKEWQGSQAQRDDITLIAIRI